MRNNQKQSQCIMIASYNTHSFQIQIISICFFHQQRIFSLVQKHLFNLRVILPFCKNGQFVQIKAWLPLFSKSTDPKPQCLLYSVDLIHILTCWFLSVSAESNFLVSTSTLAVSQVWTPGHCGKFLLLQKMPDSGEVNKSIEKSMCPFPSHLLLHWKQRS